MPIDTDSNVKVAGGGGGGGWVKAGKRVEGIGTSVIVSIIN